MREVMRAILKKNILLLMLFMSAVSFLVLFQVIFYTNQQPSLVFKSVPKNQFEAWEQIQQHRKRLARKACAKFPADTADETRHVFEALRMDDIHHLLYCPVPKIASSQWKLVLLQLSGRVDSSAGKYSTALAKTIPELKDFEHDEAYRRFTSFTKFMFTRHPFERVLSAYRNKMTHKTPDKEIFHRRYGTEIVRRYRPNASERSLRMGDDVKFEEFVKYIIDTYNVNGTYALDPHWRPVVDICRPCSVSYEVMGKFETIDLDADYIMEKGKADFSFPKSDHAKRTRGLMDKYFRNITSADRQRLYKVYEKDFAVFDYERTPMY